jgi:hypothetical protein
VSRSEIDALRYSEGNKMHRAWQKGKPARRESVIFRHICYLFTGFDVKKSPYNIRTKEWFVRLAQKLCTRCQTHTMFPQIMKSEYTTLNVK